MLFNIKEIKGGKMMTTEQMAKCQDEMQGKVILAYWDTPCKPYLFVKLSPNKDKAKQISRHDEYAGYMPDFDFEVKDGKGEQRFLDGHNGVEYFIFDDLETARKAVHILNEIDKTDWLKRDIRDQIESFNKIGIDDNICADIRNAMGHIKKELDAVFNACVTRNNLLLEQLKK